MRTGIIITENDKYSTIALFPRIKELYNGNFSVTKEFPFIIDL